MICVLYNAPPWTLRPVSSAQSCFVLRGGPVDLPAPDGVRRDERATCGACVLTRTPFYLARGAWWHVSSRGVSIPVARGVPEQRGAFGRAAILTGVDGLQSRDNPPIP